MTTTSSRRPALAALAAALFAACTPAPGAPGRPPSAAALRGGVSAADGRPAAGAMVTATSLASGIATTAYTDAAGRFALPVLPAGRYAVTARRHGLPPAADTVDLPRAAEWRPALPSGRIALEHATPAMLLATLPDGEARRRFALDCTGCHQFGPALVFPGGQPRSRESWEQATARMLGFAGASTGFPVISASRRAGPTADWLASHIDAGTPARLEAPPADAGAAGAVLTEYPVPNPADLPHDVRVADEGILVTGMMSHVMYVLDPATGDFRTVPIPVATANPRAVEIDEDGNWWVLGGFPRRIARRDPAGVWSSWDVGMYGHDVVLGADGKAWTNGHFTRDPERIASLDPVSGRVTTHDVPTPPMADGGTTIPYGLRVAPEGRIWMTQLAGNRLVRFDPRTGEFALFDLPSPHAGPRRLDVAADGTVWVPEYAAGRVARFDPGTATFREFDYPTPAALPYIVRVDPRTGHVWVATAAANELARLDPATGAFTRFPLPHPAALVRHIDIDPRTGDVWGAYSPSPSIRPAVFRLSGVGGSASG